MATIFGSEIASGFSNATDNVVGYHFPVLARGTDSGCIILTHEAAVAFDVGTENGRELTLNLVCGHGITSPNAKASEGYRNPLEVLLSKPSGNALSRFLQKVRVMLSGD
jgi:hypothetical protein